jgi:hypothetical protein
MTTVDVENPHAGQGMVLLDIGGDVGALVVTMPASMVGEEVEIRPEGAAPRDHGHGHSHHPHVAVHERPAPDGTRIPSLVFAELTTGRYELYVKGTPHVALRVEVAGGAVTTAAWPR